MSENTILETRHNRLAHTAGAVGRELPGDTSFNLVRWFAVIGLASIGLFSIFSALLLSRFLTDRMLQRDAVVTLEFVQSSMESTRASGYFLNSDTGSEKRELEAFFRRMSSMSDVLRANVYDRDRTMIWSSNEKLIGRKFPDNPELTEALRARLVVHSGRVGDEHEKEEHEQLAQGGGYYVENYVPVRDKRSGEIIGVVELYRTPRALFDTIHEGHRLIWASALAGGMFLYLALFWLVRRADRIIRQQQQQLIQTETLAVIGEMSSAIAHSIRNPLASIRSSAELALEEAEGHFRETAEDIISDADRLEGCIRDLLTYSRPVEGAAESLVLASTLRASVDNYRREMERHGIRLELDLNGRPAAVKGDSTLLRQVFNSIIANAVEAMAKGGTLRVSSRVLERERRLQVDISDTGSGMSPEQLAMVFKPFFTTKRRGLGLGLSLVRRIVERYGGRVSIESEQGMGTTVSLQFGIIGE